jgi:5-aminolevulinate synthase
MTYDHFCSAAVAHLHEERRYRVFAVSNGSRGASLTRYAFSGWPTPVVIWCSNDYLGMGQHRKVIDAMVQTATA